LPEIAQPPTEVQARGLTPQNYVQNLIEDAARRHTMRVLPR